MAIHPCHVFDEFAECVTAKRTSGILTSWEYETKEHFSCLFLLHNGWFRW